MSYKLFGTQFKKISNHGFKITEKFQNHGSKNGLILRSLFKVGL